MRKCNNITVMFNSHRTYIDNLIPLFSSELGNFRNINNHHNEFIEYKINDLKVILDSYFTVYITNTNNSADINEIEFRAKNEYLFLCSLSNRFDKRSPINISVPTDFYIPDDSKFQISEFDDVKMLSY